MASLQLAVYLKKELYVFLSWYIKKAIRNLYIDWSLNRSYNKDTLFVKIMNRQTNG